MDEPSGKARSSRLIRAACGDAKRPASEAGCGARHWSGKPGGLYQKMM